MSQVWDDWPVVELNGQRWAVSPRYVGGVGIANALTLTQSLGCTLPSVALVDAIHKAADCKLDASRFVRRHDGTARTMSSPEVMKDQDTKVLDSVELWEETHGRARLVSGTHKDVILDSPGKGKAAKLGLYGWFRADGKPIQPPFYGHAGAWRDYSQGARLVRLVP